MRTSTAVSMLAGALLTSCSREATGPSGPPPLAQLAVLAQDDWTLKSPATKPSPRCCHAMASIGGDQVLLFGGFTHATNRDDETWVYDLSDNAWTLKSPGTKPSGRYYHAMASIGGDQVLLFGGFLQGVGSDDETWVYDLSDNTWTQKSPATHPSARFAHAMASIGGDQVLLFGGFVTNDETWVYDLSDDTWTLKSPATHPSARFGLAMSFISGDQVLLFGGFDYGSFYDDTWVYDLSDNTWTQKSPATKPSARYTHAMAYVGGDQVLLFGGQVADLSISDETWVYDLSDNTWTLKSPPTKPSAGSSNVAMASIGGAQALLFGGVGFNDETWVYAAGRQVAIDIKPGSNPGTIKLGSKGTTPVAILSTADFDAVAEVDRTSLTFGRTGDEASLAFCGTTPKDVNADGRPDLVCHFTTSLTGFQVGDTEGILKGETMGGTPIEGRDGVRVIS